MPTSFYVKQLIDAVPKEAFKPALYKLVPMIIHALLIVAYVIGAKYFNNSFSLILFAILTGISIACLFLYSHELSHGNIVRNKKSRYILENIFWAFSGIPPTVWNNVHNHSHHLYMNTYKDPDRKTFKSEKSILNDIYNILSIQIKS